jgi:hypothetical protein
MFYLSYSADPTRDSLANSSQLGAGKVPLQFSEDTRCAKAFAEWLDLGGRWAPPHGRTAAD